MASLDVSGLTPLDTGGLAPLDDVTRDRAGTPVKALDISGLKLLDATGLKPVEETPQFATPDEPSKTFAPSLGEYGITDETPRGTAPSGTEAVMSAVGRGAAQGFGEQPVGFSDENRANYPKTYLLWQPVAAPADVALRAPGAIIGALSAGATQIYKQFGGSDADAARLERDLNILGQGVLIESGMGGHHNVGRPEVVERPLSVAQFLERVDAADSPVVSDFQKKTLVQFGLDPAAVDAMSPADRQAAFKDTIAKGGFGNASRQPSGPALALPSPDTGAPAEQPAAPPPPRQPGPAAAAPQDPAAAVHDALVAYGYTENQIARMNPRQLAAEYQNAVAAGAVPEAAGRPQASPASTAPLEGGASAASAQAPAGEAEAVPPAQTEIAARRAEMPTSSLTRAVMRGKPEVGADARLNGDEQVAEARIDKIAVRDPQTGKVWAEQGVVHSDLVETASSELGIDPDAAPARLQDGFTTTDGRFVDREEAARIATAAGQAKQPLYEDERGPYLQHSDLTSAQGDGSRAAPIQLEDAAMVHHAAQRTAEPTPAQAEAGNYTKRHLQWHGLDLAIETEAGQARKGVGPDGAPWSVTLEHPYGYIKRTVGKDGDQVDAYIGPHPDSGKVFVVDQVDPDTRKFDEHKLVIGARDVKEAAGIYEHGFSDGSAAARWGAVTEMSVPQLKAWLANGDMNKPLAYKPQQANVRRSPGAPLSLFQFLAKNGGIKDDGGELRAMGLENKFVPGFGRLVRPTGKDLDHARESAAEAGYPVGRFGSADERMAGSTVNDLLDLLHREHHGARVFSDADAGELASREEGKTAKDEAVRVKEIEADVRARARDMGTLRLTDEEVQAAVEHVRVRGADIDEALTDVIERAALAAEDHLVELETGVGDAQLRAEDQQGGVRDQRRAANEAVGAGAARAEPPSARQRATEPRTEVPSGDQAARQQPDGAQPHGGEQAAEGPAAAEPVDLKVNNPTESTPARESGPSHVRPAPSGDDLEIPEFLRRPKPDKSAPAPESASQNPASPDVEKRGTPAQNDSQSTRFPKTSSQVNRTPESAIRQEADKRWRNWVPGKNAAGYTVLTRPRLPTFIKEVRRERRDRERAEAKARAAEEKSQVKHSAQINKSVNAKTERTAAGEQAVMPGAEKIGEGELAQRKADEGLKPKVAQKPADQGLFGDESKQTDLVDMAKQKPVTNDTTKSDDAAPSITLADTLYDRLSSGQPITAKILQDEAAAAHGAKLADGKFDRRDMADALELGLNMWIKENPDLRVDGPAGKDVIPALGVIVSHLPTQRVRSEEQVRFQQFSTPPNYAAAAVYAANLRDGDTMLEPSAGTGSIVAAASEPGVKIIANELSERRAELLRHLVGSDGRVFTENAEQLDNILPADVKPTVVVMNPPFSQTAGRMGDKKDQTVAQVHIEQALNRLEPGGRLVAIVGEGMTLGSPTHRAFWTRIGAENAIRASIGVPGKVYEKYGTTFGTRLYVIDKVAPDGTKPVTAEVSSIDDMMKVLEPIRDGRPVVEHGRAEPRSAGVAGEGARGRAEPSSVPVELGAVGTGRRRGGRLAEGERGVAPASREPLGLEAGEHDALAAQQPEWSGPGRATQQPARGALGSEKRGSGGGVRAQRNLEPSASGQSGAPAGGERIELENAAPSTQKAAQGLSESLYDHYEPRRAKVKGAQPHPGPLVESAAMASVNPPPPKYTPHLPPNVVSKGLLSTAQLEPVIYAGQAHTQMLPAGEGETPRRKGYFIGDGTGVGKGREVAGIILDNWSQGRTRHVWVSEKRTLLQDAKRDWKGLGQNDALVFDAGKVKAGEPITAERGIGFITYDTLKGGMSDQAAIASGGFVRKQSVQVNGREGTVQRIEPGRRGNPAQITIKFGADEAPVTVPANEVTAAGEMAVKSRVDQLVDWLGKDFDGVIAFDEAHNMGNASTTKGERGLKEAAQKALAGIDLQNRLPNARVVYVSATGATEVSNLAYADRLGLWGRGTPFASRDVFISEVSSGGIAAMELVARDMKQLGLYGARNLSYDGVEYQRIEHKLDANQREIYDTLAEAWQVVLNNINTALEATGGNKDARAKSAASSAFWGAHQRFFNQIVTSMQMPSVIKAVEADLKAGRQAVLQLTNTNEASQERAAAKAESAEAIEDLDITPRDQIIQLIERSFPTQQYERYVDENGKERSRPVVDSDGNPVQNRQAVAMRETLIDRLASIRVPQGPLDMVLDTFGTDVVAEVTGRGRRFVLKPDEKTGEKRRVEESRPGSANLAETDAFQSGKKKILVFSEAGGTGRSYHADNTSASKDARRAHYLVQGGWRADKAVQGFGRTHRTNQASAPIVSLVTTDLQGQKRFISSIARRLSQLGALTKGQRQAGDQGIFSARDNLESHEASLALHGFYRDVLAGRVEGVPINEFEQQTGLKLRSTDEEGRSSGMTKDPPPITQFLNRLLSLKIDMQNGVFDAFSKRLDAIIEARAQAGLLDAGLETVRADKITKDAERTVHTIEESGAKTNYVKFELANKFEPIDLDTVARSRDRPVKFWVRSERGKVYAATEAQSLTNIEGAVIDQLRIINPVSGSRVLAATNINGRDSKWVKIDKGEAERLWKAETEAAPEFVTRDMHLITGAILPIWDRLKGDTRVVRLQTDEGERFIGRVVPRSQLAETLKRLGADAEQQKIEPGDLYQHLMQGGRATLANGWKLSRRVVAGEQRIELTGPNTFSEGQEVQRDGVFTERINYQTRYFVPAAETAGAETLRRLTQFRPVSEMGEKVSLPDHPTGFEEPRREGLSEALRGAMARFTDLSHQKPIAEPGTPHGQAAQDYVLKEGRSTGREFMVAYDRNGKMIARGAGTENTTGMPIDLMVRMMDDKQSVVVHHNHPSNTSLSWGDVAHLALPGLHSLWAHGHGGAVARAELTPQARKVLAKDPAGGIEKLYGMAKEANGALYDVVQNAVNEGLIGMDEAWAQSSHLNNVILRDAGIIHYESNITAAKLIARLDLDPYIKTATKAVRSLFYGRDEAAAAGRGVDRPAQPVRHKGELGASFERTAGAAIDRATSREDDRNSARNDRQERRGGGQLELGLAEPKSPFDPPKTPVEADPVEKRVSVLRSAAEKAMAIFDEAQMKVAPMAVGSTQAMAAAKDYANAVRQARNEWARRDELIKKNFSVEERARMWEAADRESVALQTGTRLGPDEGLAALSPREQSLTRSLQAEADRTYAEAQAVGIVESEGIPSYVPRMMVMVDAAGVYHKPPRDAGGYAGNLEGVGRGFRTTTGQTKQRHYLTAAETEAAMKKRFGPTAAIARDIRALSLATAKLQEAVAARTLVNTVKSIGNMTGAVTVSEGSEPQDGQRWFTLDHPAFKTYRPALKRNPATGKWETAKYEDGSIAFERVPVYIRSDFKGPLLAVLGKDNGRIYNAFMSLKGKAMSMVMYSPVIHNMVEYSRALPAYPLKVASTWIYFEGNAAKNDPTQMREAVDAGLVPIGKRFFNQDITSIMEEPTIAPRRSWTAEVLGFVPGLFDPHKGEAVKRAVDVAGDVWHNKLLWDRVADLQMGLYVNMRRDLIAKGYDALTASRVAAHFANRYAGALPIEAMSTGARKLANIILFSRTFTFGNLGAMKDSVTGMPRDVQAQILRDAGEDALGKIKNFARRKSIAILMLDIALGIITTSLMQDAFKKLRGDKDWLGENELFADYYRRFIDLIEHTKDHPANTVLHPINSLWKLSSTMSNEPRKREGMEARVLLYHDKNGRAVYGRNPFGKIGEEFTGWPTAPGDMLLRKLGTFTRPALQTMLNDKYAGSGFDRPVPIWRPNPEGLEWFKNAGRIAKTFAEAQLPGEALRSAADLADESSKKDPFTSKLKILAPFAGVSISQGHPKGMRGALTEEKRRDKMFDKALGAR